MKNNIVTLVLLLAGIVYAQNAIQIDGQFTDWENLPVLMTDPANDVHDTESRLNGFPAPEPVNYSDVDILEVKFTHDAENLYAYVKATGIVGRTSSEVDGYKAGRYYYIITIDVDNNDVTGYPLEEGGYWPNSIGYDMNMEIEFYNGTFNTGHYLHHGYMSEQELPAGLADLENHIIRLAPANYDDYLQWVLFPDSSYVLVSDKGPVYQGIITVAVSEDGHETEMMAPMWGFFNDENGDPIIALGDTLDISFSLEGSGELSESAQALGYNGLKSLWGSDTADPIVGYVLTNPETRVLADNLKPAATFQLNNNYPNPFNSQTVISYSIFSDSQVKLAVFDIQGRLVKSVKNEFHSPGAYTALWDGLNEQNYSVSSGVYMAVLTTENNRAVKRMIMLK